MFAAHNNAHSIMARQRREKYQTAKKKKRMSGHQRRMAARQHQRAAHAAASISSDSDDINKGVGMARIAASARAAHLHRAAARSASPRDIARRAPRAHPVIARYACSRGKSFALALYHQRRCGAARGIIRAISGMAHRALVGAGALSYGTL